jgi:ATP-dependent DNA helicase RecG
MPASIDRLLKYFQIEKEKQYNNRTIIGGLDKILGNWLFDARNDHIPEPLISEIKTGLENYSAISPEARQELLDELIQDIRQFSGSLKSEKASSTIQPGPAKPQALVQTAENKVHEASKLDNIAQPEATPPPVVSKPAPYPQAVNGNAASPQPVSSTKPVTAMQSAAPRAVTQPAGEIMGLNAPVTTLRGVASERANTYKKIGIKSLNDLLYYFPRRYDDFSQLKTINHVNVGDELTIIATVQSCSVVAQPHLVRGEVIVSDGTDYMRLVFFRRGQYAEKFFEHNFNRGNQLVISGTVTAFLGRKQMVDPYFEPIDKVHLNTNGIIPVYPLTTGLTEETIRDHIHQVISRYTPKVPDFLPENIRESAKLASLSYSLSNIHYPSSQEALKTARDRLAFDEIFLLQLGVLQQKQNWQGLPASQYSVSDESLNAFLGNLPYSLTGAQQKVIGEIRLDLASGHPMNRLLQGDVGSGKTVVAAVACWIIACNGAQAAFMAPTSILAEQHYRSLVDLLASENSQTPRLSMEEIALLTGDTSDAEKRRLRQALAEGSIKLLIGTHALIEDNVEFKNLQLAVIDEQHRFGVAQRAKLREKGSNPHLLVMTATPIPRSLALTLYGDLELSIMDEMPAGRQPVETYVLSPLERERVYQFIRTHVSQGNQAFLVYPLIENSDESDVKAAINEHDQLQKEIFPEFKLGLLHGRMKPDEKDRVMLRFREKEFQILVSTTVIEVGVDVPNATIMLVEGAERFGLAQLHQLRGRVGRGSDKSYCLLIPSTDDATENARLAVMTETNDGFVLAEKDLSQRGPGDFIGYRQSGFADLKLANITDIRLIEKARSQAEGLFALDPLLQKPENQALARRLTQFWQSTPSDIS